MNATVACRNPISTTDISWKKVSMACFLGALLLSPASNARAQSNEPALKISGTNGNITVSWPAAFYYSALAGTLDEPSPSASWFWVSTATPMFSLYNLTSFVPTNLYNAPVTATVLANECQFTLPVTNAQQYFKLMPMRQIPLFQFFIFYDGLLEFSTAATLNINGTVHANGPIYTGSGSPLTFYDTVTTAANFSSPLYFGSTNWVYTGTFLGNPATVTNTLPLRPDVGTDDLHAIIDMPPPGEDPESQLGSQRYYNKAAIILLVNNSTATVIIKSSPTDISPVNIVAFTYGTNSPFLRNTFPFLSITNLFNDRRESWNTFGFMKTNRLTQIDIGLYNQWLLTNSAVNAKFPPFFDSWPNILYVADNRTTSSNSFYSVRLTNGVAIPTNGNTGFTLATRNPLYVWGDYNCPPEFAGTTNTSGIQPASLVCDAITILSTNWSDPKSFGSYGSQPPASSTAVNAAIITGNTPSTGITTSTFSGGIHNLVRLLENWTAKVNTLNGSIVCLYKSGVATNKFIWPGTTYNPPTRLYNFDQNFKDLTKLPPGTPLVGTIGN
ncbi:MAG: hypothetical protein HOP33_11295 [Verrucomicrobia bacterium]|nr:hypothetical protein [Verrucomicrobiota bacterium]